MSKKAGRSTTPDVVLSVEAGQQHVIKQGGTDMGDKGSKDKGKREQQKTAQHTAKEKRKMKKEKKNK